MLAYRYITDQDADTFCHRVTQALAKGWQLYGHPAYVFDSTANVMRCGQAVVKEVEVEYDPAMKLRDL